MHPNAYEDPDEMRHFIRIYIVCKDKYDPQRKKKKTVLFGNHNLWPLDIYNGPSKVLLYRTRRKIPLVHKG